MTFRSRSEEDYNMWLLALRPFVINTDIWSTYFISKLIGQGSFGKVFLASRFHERTSPTEEPEPDMNQKVAIKIMEKSNIV